MEKKVQFYSEGTPMAGLLGLPDDYQAGEQRAAVIFCQGFTGVKEMLLPENAKRLRAEGYVTLNFDYRVDRIGPRAMLWIHTDKDKLVPLFEAQSMYAKARQPKKLVVLENMVHEDVYRGEGFEQTMEHTSAWFREHLPAR